jgi:hypothetical protein
VLYSPAAVIVKAKSQWAGDSQPLTALLKLYHKQRSTEIRDKVHALHGLAHDSDAIAIDYRIGPKALPIEVIYHACSPQAFQTDKKKTKMEVPRLLHFNCNDEELVLHISVARGDAVSIEKDYGLRMRDQEDPYRISKPTPPDIASDLRTSALLDPTGHHYDSEDHSLDPLGHRTTTAYPYPNNTPVGKARTRRRIAIACTRCLKEKTLYSGDPGIGFGCTNCMRAGMEASTCQFPRVGSTISAKIFV